MLGSEGIKWNFTKFLVGKDGVSVTRYGSIDTPASVSKDIATALAS
jgi:glutathione peroxidase